MKTPVHIGFIVDGNRRWARERNLPDIMGHIKGRKKLKDVCKWCKKRGIKIITIYAFSIENWQRQEKEVRFLMGLIEKAIREDAKEVHREGYKMKIIGQREKLPGSLQRTIEKAEELTKNNKDGILNLAISYGGRTEIIEAFRNIVKQGIPVQDVNEDLISKNLWTAGLPDPDLIIRTSGEQRTSGFLTWQSAYSELYFTPAYWPDFGEKDLDLALEWFSGRKRRFGK